MVKPARKRRLDHCLHYVRAAWYSTRLLTLMCLCLTGALVAAGVVWLAERHVPDSPYQTYAGTIRGIAVLLFSGWDVSPPATPVGFWGAFITLLFGVTFVATMTAEIAASWIEERLNKRGEVHAVKATDHILVCNNSPHLRLVINQFMHPDCPTDATLVVLADDCPKDLMGLMRVVFVRGDPTDDEALLRAGVERAQAAIILAVDPADPAGSDSRSVLTALAVEALNPAVYTVVEIINPSHVKHLAHAKVDEVIAASNLGAKLAVQASLHPGLARFVDSLLTFDDNGEFYTAALPPQYAGLTVNEVLQRLHSEYGCILLGALREGEMHLLTSADERLGAGDTVFFLALRPPEFMR